jgi:uncharacterized protein YebE (UPF0316 family)
MSTSVALTFVIIVLARIVDVSLDTVRTAAIVQGRRVFAATLGFVQAVIYISVIAKVLLDVDHPVYVLAYGLGFALGTYLGIAIEQRLAFGQEVASLFTTRGTELANTLIAAGYRVAAVHAHGERGEMTILHVEVPRKRARGLLRDAWAIDEDCFCIVNDVRVAEYASGRVRPAGAGSGGQTA